MISLVLTLCPLDRKGLAHGLVSLSLSSLHSFSLFYSSLMSSLFGCGKLSGNGGKGNTSCMRLFFPCFLQTLNPNHRSMRRKYGIPDNDHRPFNVAYAAAQLAREQEDQQRARKRRAVQVPAQVSSAREQRDSVSDQVKQRPGTQHTRHFLS